MEIAKDLLMFGIPIASSLAMAMARGDTETTDSAQSKPKMSLEDERRSAEQDATNSLDQDAIAAILETQHAIQSVAANKTEDAKAALERATGKIEIALARNPEAAFIPVHVEVQVIDTAPRDFGAIADVAEAAQAAVVLEDYPAARALLFGLMSEIRVRTFSLPVATYPVALTEAARLLEQNNTQAARAVLLTALNTLLATDRVIPIPLLLAREEINEAESMRDSDRASARRLLEVARGELVRAMALGYAGKDPEYKAIADDISNLEKQLKDTADTVSVFSRLKQRLASFIKRQSEADRSARPQAGQKDDQTANKQPGTSAA